MTEKKSLKFGTCKRQCKNWHISVHQISVSVMFDTYFSAMNSINRFSLVYHHEFWKIWFSSSCRNPKGSKNAILVPLFVDNFSTQHLISAQHLDYLQGPIGLPFKCWGQGNSIFLFFFLTVEILTVFIRNLLRRQNLGVTCSWFRSSNKNPDGQKTAKSTFNTDTYRFPTSFFQSCLLYSVCGILNQQFFA